MVDYATLYSSADDWNNDVLANTKFTTKTAVDESTQSVALVNPVQYAVAQLKVTIRANAIALPDGMKPAANNITVDTDKFPLTGVIVGGQRAVNYQFEQSSNSDDVKFVYDSQVMTNGGDYFYLAYSDTEATDNTPGSNTLVLQSYDNEDVTIILEFENNSGQSFYGINENIIYPGTRFYLVGTIHPTYDSTKGDYTRRVFTKDYITRVNVTVSSLAKAYNVLPNILSSNLEVGVEVVPKWIAAQPTTVVLL